MSKEQTLAAPAATEPAPPESTDSATVEDYQRTVGGFVMDDDDDEDDDEQNPPPSKPPDILVNGQVNGTAEDNQKEESLETATTNMKSPSPVLSSVAHGEAAAVGETTHNAFQSALAPSNAVPESIVSDLPVPSTTPVPAPTAPSDGSAMSVPKARLAHDLVGMLEDRIKEDPKGDIDAWLSLLAEHRKRNKFDEVRDTYERFFQIFPTAAEQWVAYAEMELESNNFYQVEQIFAKSLMNVPNLQLWTTYLNYVRRRNNVSSDKTGKARETVTETYEFVLDHVGQDKDSGSLWQDYVQFVRSSPEQIGGTSWQEQQKMDNLRRLYQRAICIPTQAVQALWKEYDTFETTLNKQTERSPAYMTARSASTALQTITQDLKRTTLPKLPPAPGFEGDIEYARQVELWNKWIAWEKEDPLVLKQDDPGAFRKRIVFVYKQALMALRFWPQLWFDAADFCFSKNLEQEGMEFLTHGVSANPESCLLALKRADRIEMTTIKEDNEEALAKRGAAVREPHDKVLDALYEICAQVAQREIAAVTRAREEGARLETENGVEGEDGEAIVGRNDAALNAQIDAIQKGAAAQLNLLSKTISFVWIALMRAMRRVQGKGKPGDIVGGSRQIFADSRKRGRLTSDVYIANALIEHHCYQDPVAAKIFDRGLKLFPEEEHIALEYIKYLVATNDTTNARAVFETSVTRLGQNPRLVHKARPLYVYFHSFESKFGDLGQVAKLETRMRDLFTDDPQLRLFAQRFSDVDFDPTAIRPIISPSTQARPKSMAPLSVDKISSAPNSPRTSLTGSVPLGLLSPKRALDESDSDAQYPRKQARAKSPLKGAAGRRAADAKSSQLRQEIKPTTALPITPLLIAPVVSGPAPLPPDVHYLLSILPRAETYHAARFNPDRMIDLLRSVELSRAQLNQRHIAQQPQLPGQSVFQQNRKALEVRS